MKNFKLNQYLLGFIISILVSSCGWLNKEEENVTPGPTLKINLMGTDKTPKVYTSGAYIPGGNITFLLSGTTGTEIKALRGYKTIDGKETEMDATESNASLPLVTFTDKYSFYNLSVQYVVPSGVEFEGKYIGVRFELEENSGVKVNTYFTAYVLKKSTPYTLVKTFNLYTPSSTKDSSGYDIVSFIASKATDGVRKHLTGTSTLITDSTFAMGIASSSSTNCLFLSRGTSRGNINQGQATYYSNFQSGTTFTVSNTLTGLEVGDWVVIKLSDDGLDLAVLNVTNIVTDGPEKKSNSGFGKENYITFDLYK